MRQLFLTSAALSLTALGLAACSSASAEVDETPSLAGSAQVGAGGRIEVSDFIGTLIIETGRNKGYSSKSEPGAAVRDGLLDAPGAQALDNGIRIIGDEDVKIKNCSSSGGKHRIQLKGHETRPLSDYPVVRITAPSDAVIDLGMRGGLATIGDLDAAHVSINGCGDVELSDVTGELEVGINGSGDLLSANVGQLNASVKGSGDIVVGDVAGDAQLSIMGSGDIGTGTVNGSISASIRGSGDIRTGGGSGDLDVSIRGSGDVRIDGGEFEDAKLSIAGSGDIKVNASVTDLNVDVAGSGDIRVIAATGKIHASRRGSGDIVVNGKEWTEKGWK
ncbi:MAG: hypothetical protein CME88_14845 [Hirschia sp.]|nr:hypothetical protein [Hirschia sp.]MBF19653.1 hypothetical protein [Hirschia sp.]